MSLRMDSEFRRLAGSSHASQGVNAPYMALGAAQVTGQPAALCVAPGPGMLNAGAGLTSACWDNARLLALIGSMPSARPCCTK